MFATFAADKRYRGTQILVADKPEGPYAPLTDGPITPPNWQCLDGTLYVDPDGAPWIVFCREWMQIHNGAMYAMQLSADLMEAVAPPVFLFNASEAPWAYPPAGRPKANARSSPAIYPVPSSTARIHFYTSLMAHSCIALSAAAY